MKKGLALIAIVVIAVAVYFVIFNKKEKTAPASKTEKPERLAISKNPAAFNDSFTAMLSSYYNIKNALVNWDSSTAAAQAQMLTQQASALPVSLLEADSSLKLTANNFRGAVAAESEKLANAKTIADERRAFSVLTDNLYSLINTVRYDKEAIYYDRCPMAFNDEEQAFWLSRDSAIVNPYLGNKHPKYKSAMISCGDVEQYIDYAAVKK